MCVAKDASIPPKTAARDRDVVVIGSGLKGLVAANLLSLLS